jgi:hypothetical protein
MDFKINGNIINSQELDSIISIVIMTFLVELDLMVILDHKDIPSILWRLHFIFWNNLDCKI